MLDGDFVLLHPRHDSVFSFFAVLVLHSLEEEVTVVDRHLVDLPGRKLLLDFRILREYGGTLLLEKYELHEF